MDERFKGLPDLFDGMAEMDESQAEANTEKLIRDLQAWHRELSEQILKCNRGLARLAVTNKDEEKAALRARLAELRAKRTEIESDIEGESKALKEHQRRNVQQKATAGGVAPSKENGLTRQRHPNRDFFLADMFDYAMKDDGATMEAPIFTLATKPDLSIWTWESKDKSKSIKVTPSVLGRATQFDKMC